VKTNLGHSEAVSGITSVIKVTLALENRLLPPTVGIRNINPELKLPERNIEVVTSLISWPETMTLRASVNSFGYGGANAHAIIEAADLHVPEGYQNNSGGRADLDKTLILPFSAHRPESLVDNVVSIASLEIKPRNLVDLAHTLGSCRSALSVRGYLLAQANNLGETIFPENLTVQEPGRETLAFPFAFVFTGQGAQWPEMGRELFQRFTTYKRTIQRLDQCLASLSRPPSWSIEGIYTCSVLKNANNETSRCHYGTCRNQQHTQG